MHASRRRWIVRSVIWIVLGFVTTCAVSSCCSAFVGYPSWGLGPPDRVFSLNPSWDLTLERAIGSDAWRGAPARWAATTGHSRRVATELPPNDREWLERSFPSHELDKEPEALEWRQRFVVLHGWPQPAFWHSIDEEGSGRIIRRPQGAIVIGGESGHPVVFERTNAWIVGYCPLWTGIAIDTALFAFAWFVAWLGARALRRRTYALTWRAWTAIGASSFVLGAVTAAIVAMVLGLTISLKNQARLALDGMIWVDGQSRMRSVTRIATPLAVDYWVEHYTIHDGRGRFDPKATATNAMLAFMMRLDEYDAWRMIVSRGWPEPCLWGGVMANTGKDQDSRPYDTYWSITGEDDPWALQARSIRLIPLHPIWSGLLKDALVFTPAWIVVLLIAIGPRRLLLLRRLRRRRCPRCRYPLKEFTRCPECGTDPEVARSRLVAGERA